MDYLFVEEISQGFKYLLVINDHFTKYAVVVNRSNAGISS